MPWEKRCCRLYFSVRAVVAMVAIALFASNLTVSVVFFCTLCSSEVLGDDHRGEYVGVPGVLRGLIPIFRRNDCSVHCKGEVMGVGLVCLKRSTIPSSGLRYLLVCMFLLC